MPQSYCWYFVTTGRPRSGRLRVLVLGEEETLDGPLGRASLGPALARLHRSGTYAVEMAFLAQAQALPLEVFARSVLSQEGCALPQPLDTCLTSFLPRLYLTLPYSYDALWVVSGFKGAADRFVRSLPPWVGHEMARGLAQRRALILWGDPPDLPSTEDGDEARKYDVIYYQTEPDREAMEAAFRHPNLQHAFGVSLSEPAPPLRPEQQGSWPAIPEGPLGDLVLTGRGETVGGGGC